MIVVLHKGAALRVVTKDAPCEAADGIQASASMFRWARRQGAKS